RRAEKATSRNLTLGASLALLSPFASPPCFSLLACRGPNPRTYSPVPSRQLTRGFFFSSSAAHQAVACCGASAVSTHSLCFSSHQVALSAKSFRHLARAGSALQFRSPASTTRS